VALSGTNCCHSKFHIFASVSFIGLAVGFGAREVVQDIVTGKTLVFADLIDVGNLDGISSETGIVQSITLRLYRIYQ